MKIADIEYMQKLHAIRYNQELELGNVNSDDPLVRDIAIKKNIQELMKQYDGLILSTS